MFITNKRSGYNRNGEQFASGKFLILMQETPGNGPGEIQRVCKAPIRCLVRPTHFTSLGNFCMGFAMIHGRRLTLSGAYGGDGLPVSVDAETYARGLELPDELRGLWSNGKGWNGAGNEMDEMKKWALANLPKLSK